MSSTKSIEDLSEELLLEIFKYLSLYDLIFSIQFVNNKWKRVSYDNDLWRNRVYSPSAQDSDENIENILKITPNLNVVNLENRPYAMSVIEVLINHCPNIRKIDFNHYQTLNSQLISNLVHKYPKLEHLQFPYRTLDNLEQCHTVGNLHKLRVLKVGGWADSQHPTMLKPIADGCPSLEHIDLLNTYCQSSDLEYFLLKKKNVLHTLYIKWGYDEGKCVLPLLLICTALKTLCVEGYYDAQTKLGFETMKTLKNVTSLSLLDFDTADITNIINIFDNNNLCQLTELVITHYEYYENQLAKVIVHNCPNLTKLFINECNSLSDESVEDYDKLRDLQYVELKSSAITDISVECLIRCKKLKHLSLENCFLLSEEGLCCMTEFHNLQVLKLDSCDLKGLQWTLIPSHLKYLTYLSINFCQHVDGNMVNYLHKEMPSLTVHFVADRVSRSLHWAHST